MKNSLIDNRFKLNVLFSYITQLIGVGAGFISTTLITRYAGIETLGMIAAMNALSGILANLMTFRTNEAVINFYKKGEANNTLGLCRLALLAGLILDMGMGVLLLILVQLFSPLIANSLLKHPDLQTDVVIFSGVMFAKFLRGTPLGLLVAEERFRFINMLNLGEQVLKVLLLGAMVFFGVTLTFKYIIYSIIIPAVLVTFTVYLFPLIKLIGPLRGVPLPKDQCSDYVRFSLNTFLSSTLKAGNQNIDTIILGYLTNTSEVGIYSLFSQFLSPMAMVSAPFSSQITPRFVQAIAENRSNDIRDTISHANNLLIRGFFLILIVIVPIMVIYGKYNNLNFTLEHYAGFSIMIVSAFFSQQFWWCRSFSISTQPKFSVQAGILASAITPFAVYFLISITGGFLGAATGILITQVMLMFFWMTKLKIYT